MSSNTSNRKEEQIDIRAILANYISKWKWFALSLIIAIAGCVLFLRYKSNIYQSKAKLLIKYEKAGTYSELSAFQDLGLFEGISGYNNLYNEQEILKSRALLGKVVTALNLDVQYNIIGTKTGIDRGELYTETPILIKVPNKDSLASNQFNLTIQIVSESKYSIQDTKHKNINFGEIIKTDEIGDFSIIKTAKFNENYIGRVISVIMSPTDDVISSIKSQINIEPLGEDVDILELSIKGRSINKNNDILNQLISEHTEQTIEDQKKIYVNTTDFIDSRIKEISTELSDVEIGGQEYQTDYQFSDIYLSEKSLYDRVLLNERKLSEAKIQLELIEFMNDYLSENADNSTLLPANLGLTNASINNSVIEYNKIVLERERIVQNSGKDNPQLRKITEELEQYRNSVKASLFNYKKNLEIEVSELEQDENELNKGISSLPKHKRIVRSIERQQEVKEALYIYLLQKREENEIASAITEGNSKVIDEAYSSGRPISPNRKMYYLFAIFVGFLIPFLIITLVTFFDNKLKTKEDLEKFNFSYLGAIPKIKTPEKIVVSGGARSPISEAFRILRTNTSFLVDSIDQKEAKSILVTSTISKEGKSFITLNLGTSYALADKKTVVIGFDLRAPKLTEYAGIDDSEVKGITEYIIEDDLTIKDLLIPSENENLFFISSGRIPPNPSELILRKKVDKLFEELKAEFDIVIVDSAPIGLVTDSLSLAKYTDAVLYISRVNYLDKNLLEIPYQYIQEEKLNNVGFVLNQVDFERMNSYGYGYTYGYGDQTKKKNFISRIFKK